jgi:hypothetical protein
MGKTPKAVTEQIPPDYATLPEAERLAIALRLARQLRAGLGLGGTISEQVGLPPKELTSGLQSRIARCYG